MRRRTFIEKSVGAGAAGVVASSLLGSCVSQNDADVNTAEEEIINLPIMPDHDDISIAQWSLVDEIRQGLWTTLDFPKLAREEFDINGIEFVNTLFEVPHLEYLNQLKQRADEYGVTMVLIMVDAEGDPCSADEKMRKQYGINHRKWIDIAHYLGCNGIRTNCRGIEGATPEENLNWAADSYWRLLDYASEAGINVVIENHGGVSNDPEWMERLFKEVDHPLFGSYPDWRQPGPDFDNLAYLEKMVPYARGMSYRNQPTEELTGRMIRISKKLGYTGWFGIESTGRDAIRQGKELLTKYLGL
jgi:L-ribulose-5-phosphate 3-epimerase